MSNMILPKLPSWKHIETKFWSLEPKLYFHHFGLTVGFNLALPHSRFDRISWMDETVEGILYSVFYPVIKRETSHFQNSEKFLGAAHSPEMSSGRVEILPNEYLPDESNFWSDPMVAGGNHRTPYKFLFLMIGSHFFPEKEVEAWEKESKTHMMTLFYL